MTRTIARTVSIGAAALLVVTSLTIPLDSPAAADTGGTFAVPELAPAAAITIDAGTPGDPCDDGEWPTGAGVLSFDLTTKLNPADVGDGTMVIDHPPDILGTESLYLYLEIDDATSETADSMTVIFDLGHDHGAPDGGDRGVQVLRDGTALAASGNLSNPSTGAALPGTQVCVDDGAGTWRIELEIRPVDLDLSSINSLVGAAVRVEDDSDPLRTSVWPAAIDETMPLSFANLVTRSPIDYVLVVDQSGSMSGDKWTSVNEAGDNIALILSELKDSDVDSAFSDAGLEPDRIGVATFSSSIGGNAEIALPLQAIPANPGSLISDALPASPGGGTPMIDGVNQSFAMFGGAASLADDPLRTRVVMLLTDGKHNVPSTLVTLTEPPFDYIPSSGCGNNSLVQVNTVAVGDDATVNVVPLDDIKVCYNGQGGSDINVYNTTGNASGTGGQLTAELTRFFITAIEPYYRWNFVGDSSGGPFTTFDMDSDESRLLLFAFWDTAADADDLTVNDGNGMLLTGSSDTDLGYSWLVVDDPVAGTWTNFDAPNSPSLKIALVDLNLDARFGVDNQPHGMNSTITLTARIVQGGSPVLGADVRVDAEVPTEGLGTFATLYQANCEPQAPRLLTVEELLERVRIRADRIRPGLDVRGGNSAQNQGASDPDPGLYQLVDGLLEECGRGGLDRELDPGLQLFDDGSHGDRVADDGVYTLEFENTEIQGSHVFRFTASGVAPDGSSFERVRQVAEYVDFAVDADETDTGDQTVAVGQLTIDQNYWVLPRSATGEYLGPGRAEAVEFTATGGQWLTDVVDYGNGFYSRVLRFPTNAPQPDVTITVQGIPVDGDDGGTFGSLKWWVWLLILLLFLILIILVLICCCWRPWRLRRRQRRSRVAA